VKTGDLLAIDAARATTVVASGVSGEAWDVVNGALYLATGASSCSGSAAGSWWCPDYLMPPTGDGTILMEFDSDLAVVWEAACPDGSGIHKNPDDGGDGFICGANGEFRADLQARQWVAR